MVGAVLSVMTTSNVQVAIFPFASVAVRVTVVVPIAAVLPIAGDWVITGDAVQLSVAVASVV